MMQPDMRNKLRNMLINDEGFRQFPYVDTTGHMTIAIGRNLQARGINFAEASLMLDDDILYFSSKLAHLLPYFSVLPEPRQIVLINMCFNLGVQGLLEFKDMLECVQRGDWNGAADGIMASKAAEQLPERYHRLAYIMKTGVI